MGDIRATIAYLPIGIGLILAVAGCSSANPIIVPPTSSPTSGVYELFLTNMPLDLLLFSALFLLILWRMGSPLRATPKRGSVLVSQVAVSGIVIAAVGALIDFYVFFTYYEWDGGAHGGYYPVYLMAIDYLVVAAAFVFISVCAVSLLITRLRFVPSLIMATVITGFNIFAWPIGNYGVLVEGGDAIVMLAGLAFLFVPPIMFGIGHLHKKGALS